MAVVTFLPVTPWAQAASTFKSRRGFPPFCPVFFCWKRETTEITNRPTQFCVTRKRNKVITNVTFDFAARQLLTRQHRSSILSKFLFAKSKVAPKGANLRGVKALVLQASKCIGNKVFVLQLFYILEPRARASFSPFPVSQRQLLVGSNCLGPQLRVRRQSSLHHQQPF